MTGSKHEHPSEPVASQPATAAPPGEMAALIAAKDWTKTALGPMQDWSPSLRMMTTFLLANRFPLLLWWGPDLVSLYNDAYAPILGTKHPQALGQPVRECWSEIWDVLRPLILTPLLGGPSTWSEDLELEIRRRGFLEETHFTVAYSPVPDESAPNGIGGVLATVHEITAHVVGERRVAALRDLGAGSAEAESPEEACSIAAGALARHPKDVPFALVYLLDGDGRVARLAGAAGVEAGGSASPRTVALDRDDEAGWPIAAAARAGRALLVDDLAARLDAVPRGPWSDPPRSALVLPIRSGPGHPLAGVFVAGVSRRLELDASYRSFFDLVTAQLAAAIASARAYQEERRRAVALEELDRAKTVFFGNVSHEFRTPLTLMLGSVEDGLEDAVDPLSPGQRERQLMVRQNAVRLLKLVNSLLDFSRIEAGRIEASYEPTDVAALTAEVASAFRSLVERAGLTLDLDCPPLPEPAFVDREMWEKIVLNLLSNAFKFTFQGGILVRVEGDARWLRLVVRDTGTGIDEAHLPHVFERFYRVQGARGRTYEGTGIGLALVRELVKLHGGSASVQSSPGEGTTFTVAVPMGSAHLPKDRVRAPRALASTALGASAFVDEAASWLAGGLPAEVEVRAPSPALGETAREEVPGATRILVADDNADMRAYLERLLRPLGSVETVADGVQALAAVRRRPPDLVLSDVMMPNLDGLGLVRALREDERTRTVPIVLLSARAGEEASVEGLTVGADDYVVKPFAARELVARVRAQVQLARLRREHAEALRESEERLRSANRELAERDRRKDEFLAVLSHELRNPLAPIRNSTLILERVAPGSDRARWALGVIERQVAQLTRLVDDLLDVTRISRNKIRLQLQRLELNDLAQRAAEDHRSLFEGAGVELRFRRAPGPVFVDGDASRLAQIIGNLLQNAAKFTPRGGAATMAVSADGAAGRAVLRVADDGAGMPADLISRLFQPFTQADATLDRSKGGLGLGLALVKALVDLHGGDIAAASPGVGGGAEFTVRLPLAQDAAPREERSSSSPWTRRRVLLIEDNADAADTLCELLEVGGHEVDVARTGREGVAKARALRPDVVLCDIGLPGMDGYEIARALRADESLRATCLVALSGYALPQDVRRATEAGFDHHLAKPPSVETLAQLFGSIAPSRVDGAVAATGWEGPPPARPVS